MSDPTVIKLPKKTLVSFTPRTKQDAVVYVDRNDNGKLDSGDGKLVIKNKASGSLVIEHKVTAAEIQRHGRRFAKAVSQAKADRPSIKTVSFSKGTCLAHWSSKWWAPPKKVAFSPSLTVSTRVTTSKQLVPNKRTVDPEKCRTVTAKKTITIGKGTTARKQTVTANAGMTHTDYPAWLESAMKHVRTEKIVNWAGQTGIHYFVGKKLFIHFAIPGKAPHTQQTTDRLRKEYRNGQRAVRTAQSIEEKTRRLAKP